MAKGPYQIAYRLLLFPFSLLPPSFSSLPLQTKNTGANAIGVRFVSLLGRSGMQAHLRHAKTYLHAVMQLIHIMRILDLLTLTKHNHLPLCRFSIQIIFSSTPIPQFNGASDDVLFYQNMHSLAFLYS